MELLAPNGMKSNLTPEQYRLARTPEFKAWFGDWLSLAKSKTLGDNISGVYKSIFKGNEEQVLFELAQQANNSNQERIASEKLAGKELVELALQLYPDTKIGEKFYPVVSKVVDKNGEPIILYHSTYNDFDSFKNESSAYYFAENPKYASNVVFGNIRVLKGQNIIPVYLKIDKIKITSSPINHETVNRYLNSKEYLDELPNGLYGKDSNSNENVWVVFYPNQIKSAIGNNGKFDTNNPDIRFEDGGETKSKKVIRRNLPINKEYKLIDSFYTGGLGENPMICENCGRPIANVAVIEDNDGKTYDVGMDCAETLSSIKNSFEFMGTQNDFKEATAIRNKVRKAVKEGSTIEVENFPSGKIYIEGKKDNRLHFNVGIEKSFFFKYLPDFKKDIINPEKNNFNPKYFDNHDFGFDFKYFKDKIVEPKEFKVDDYTVILKRIDKPNYMDDGVTVRNINNIIAIEVFKDGVSIGADSTYMYQDVPRYIINTINEYEFTQFIDKFEDGGNIEEQIKNKKMKQTKTNIEAPIDLWKKS